MKRAPVRGQAAVELALASLVFVTIIIIGIHFAEVGFLSLKVEEAANSALWETTAQQMHDISAPDWTKYQTAISNAGPSAQKRYQGFQGLSSATGSTGITQVFTKGDSLQVNCDEPSPDISSVTIMPPASMSLPTTSASMECTAQAKLYGLSIPLHLLDNGPGALFQDQHWTPVDIETCGTGRATGTSCNGKYAMLLDDWGFSGTQESQECAVQDGSGCANSGYYKLVQNIFNVTIAASAGLYGLAASRMVLQLMGMPAPNYIETNFYMSFRGEGTMFKDTLSDSHGDTSWETTPYSNPNQYQNSYSTRDACFLGLGC
jgi:hypothetical protein